MPKEVMISPFHKLPEIASGVRPHHILKNGTCVDQEKHPDSVHRHEMGSVVRVVFIDRFTTQRAIHAHKGQGAEDLAQSDWGKAADVPVYWEEPQFSDPATQAKKLMDEELRTLPPKSRRRLSAVANTRTKIIDLAKSFAAGEEKEVVARAHRVASVVAMVAYREGSKLKDPEIKRKALRDRVENLIQADRIEDNYPFIPVPPRRLSPSKFPPHG